MMRIQIVLTLLTGGLLGYFLGKHPPAEWTPLRLAGLGLAGVGFVLWSVARFQLGKSFAVTAQARQLVHRGLYAKFQNPIYYVGALTIAGMILALAPPVWLLIFVVIIPLQIWRIRKERRVLQAAFGEEYRAYRKKTWF